MGTKTDKPLDRATAWVCLISNLLVLPGLGSLVAGKRSGFFQMPMALIGLGLSVFWMISFIKIWVHTKEIPLYGGPYLLIGILGIGIFFAAWLWALATSRKIFQEVNTK